MTEPSVTYPQTFIPSRLAAGEEYATVAQILECDDLPQATLHIPHWKVAGAPMAVRVRALSLSERDQVQRVDDPVAQYCLIWQLGCVAPRFTSDQANRLSEKNPHAVEQAARFIMLLGALDRDWIDHVVTSQTGAAERSPAADPADRPRTHRMDRPTRPKVRTAPRGVAADA